MVEIHTIGGYAQIGKNMTAVVYKDEAVILDMGLYLDPYIKIQDAERQDIPESYLSKINAIPNDKDFFKKHGNKVKAICLGHAHLDHIGAVRWLASKYQAPLIASPYTIEILKRMSKDDHWKLSNKLVTLNLNSSYKVSKNITIELIYVTHSILHAAITVVHTPEGSIVYTPDYKLDNNPTIGQKTNIDRLKQLAQERDILALLVDCTHADLDQKTFSEKIAKDMLRDVLLSVDTEGHGIIVTTFASHIPRLKSVLEIGEELGREVIFVGRSMDRYIGAAEDLGLISFTSKGEVLKYWSKARSKLGQINRQRHRYLLAMTGNQGEPNAALPRIARDETPFSIMSGDIVVFSSNVIPTPQIIKHRQMLESRLKEKGARVFKDVHVSGHASGEDHREIIRMLRPKHIIPAHGEYEKRLALQELAIRLGYKPDKTIHMSEEGEVITLR